MAAVFGVDQAAIGNDATPGTIAAWDSLRHMNLVLALEEEFDIRFPENEIEQLISFGLIELSLRELMPET
jgi:acyl carrier protein